MQGNLATSAYYLIRGFKMLNQPGIRPFVIIPLLLNIAIFGGLVWYSAAQFAGLLEWMLGFIPDWLDFIQWLLWPLFFLLLLVIVAYTFSMVANFIAAPFNGWLAERVEWHLSGEQPPEQPLAEVLKDIPRAFGRELGKLVYFLPLTLLLLIVSFIPGLNILAFFISAWLLAVEYADYPMDNHRLSFAEAKRRLRSRRLSSFGLGGITLAATMVPLLNLLVMPAAVCAGTIYWVEELKQTQAV